VLASRFLRAGVQPTLIDETSEGTSARFTISWTDGLLRCVNTLTRNKRVGSCFPCHIPVMAGLVQAIHVVWLGRGRKALPIGRTSAGQDGGSR
jgi:hypothetical protein